jgi:hypothetical protein
VLLPDLLDIYAAAVPIHRGLVEYDGLDSCCLELALSLSCFKVPGIKSLDACATTSILVCSPSLKRREPFTILSVMAQQISISELRDLPVDASTRENDNLPAFRATLTFAARPSPIFLR